MYINHNFPANATILNLRENYSRLASSVQKLSTGLRVNSAADDAAGLSIRELMRSDVAALTQGARNASDAISMLQVADGALAVIDEKLIRMKELAEQAATGTYDSTQRLMIFSEFQAMGDEIDRIANATDFNGIHLLNGSLSGAHNGSGLNSTGAMKIHFGSGNDSAEDYYYVEIGDCSTTGLGLRKNNAVHNVPGWFTGGDVHIDLENKKAVLNISSRLSGSSAHSPAAIPGFDGMDYYQLPVGLENITIKSNVVNNSYVHKPHVNLFTQDGKHLTGVTAGNSPNQLKGGGTQPGFVWWNYDLNATNTEKEVTDRLIAAGLLNPNAVYDDSGLISNAGESVTVNGCTVSMVTDRTETRVEEVITVDKITSDLVFTIGGHVSSLKCNEYSLTIEADLSDEFIARITRTDGEYVPGEIISLATQEHAQKALVAIDGAIEKKDSIRANIGALQNRFENTVANITIQSENLQAAEARISDADIAAEMTTFVRNQILTQSATAMLAQANSFPQMMSRIIGI